MGKKITSNSHSQSRTAHLAVASFLFGLLGPLVFSLISGFNIYCGFLAIIGLLFGLRWRRQYIKDKKRRLGQRLLALVGTTVSLLWIALLLAGVVLPAIIEQIQLSTKSMTYNDTSASLKNTLIVPTLDSTITKGKNVIWCSSFQIVWNELENNVIGEPIQLIGAEDVSNLLNNAEQSSADLEQSCYYVSAGFVKDGIVERIQSEMARQFPSEPKPTFADLTQQDIVIYSFLETGIKFKIPFLENHDDFLFEDSKGNKTNVTSFGIRPQDGSANWRLREQVEVLYYLRDPNHPLAAIEFAIDLCKYTKPYQIVLAQIQPKKTLDQTLRDLQNKISEYSVDEYHGKIRPNDILLVPNMFWRVTHIFQELKGKSLSNQGYTGYQIKAPIQIIQFKLDRSGVKLKSTAMMVILCGPKRLVFDKPFLLYIKKRGAKHPFFVMWVDNAELLTKR